MLFLPYVPLQNDGGAKNRSGVATRGESHVHAQKRVLQVNGMPGIRNIKS